MAAATPASAGFAAIHGPKPVSDVLTRIQSAMSWYRTPGSGGHGEWAMARLVPAVGFEKSGACAERPVRRAAAARPVVRRTVLWGGALR